MRFISFKILILCILLPPVLYILSALAIESYYSGRYADEIEDIYTGDTQALLNGSVRLQNAVNRNIDTFLSSRSLTSLGLKVDVTVRAGSGKTIYPAAFETGEASLITPEPGRVAAENFGLMNQGLTVTVEAVFEHNRLLSNTILAVYILISVMILYLHIRVVGQKLSLEEQKKKTEIERLQVLEIENTERLETLIAERKKLQSKSEQLKNDLNAERRKAGRNENELIDEIEMLEKKLNENLTLQQSQEDEILEFQEKLQQHQKDRHRGKKQKAKASDTVRKRFNTLYKRLSVHERAISGFTELDDDLKLKAEEVIHQLNADSSLVTIKRKVFGRKGHETVFEVVFAYKGRLYFRSPQNQQLEVLAIGTKNSQARELEFLKKL